MRFRRVFYEFRVEYRWKKQKSGSGHEEGAKFAKAEAISDLYTMLN